MSLVLLVVCPMIAGTGLLTKAWWKKNAGTEAEELEASLVSEAVSSTRTVTALQMQDFINSLYTDALKKPEKDIIRETYITSANSGFSNVITMFCYGLIFSIGAYLKKDDHVTTTQMFVCVFVIMFAAPSIGRQSVNLPDELAAEVAAARMFRLIDLVPPIDSSSSNGLKPPSCKGDLELRGV
eukprot:CAMPEP_0185770004 /NCGR_PEP_ID=MMETSP1174-20130828/56991_1 /TAXON_ID=35687 /ORGANISM="Dictyocha speculum, Strain CCMP1381" /LENGTH=182 /DNA_ID=CAMNT_0028455281 /DNA_START=298 /DNA_END=843 /DNA_ORIENTATION=-